MGQPRLQHAFQLSSRVGQSIPFLPAAFPSDRGSKDELSEFASVVIC